MERNTERKVLSFGKGMTNVPSDLMSEDNELEVCDGFIYRDGELKPVQKPVKIGQTCMCTRWQITKTLSESWSIRSLSSATK